MCCNSLGRVGEEGRKDAQQKGLGRKEHEKAENWIEQLIKAYCYLITGNWCLSMTFMPVL